MPILIKILNESREGMSHRDMGGLSGINYRFDWSDTHSSWVYEAKTQVEIDDIIQVNFIANFPWRFSFIMPSEIFEAKPAAPGEEVEHVYRPVPAIAPWVAPTKYASFPAIDLVDLARNCGFTPQGSHTDTNNLRMQLDAYMVGRAFAMEEIKRVRAENEGLVKRLEPVVTTQVAAATSTVSGSVATIVMNKTETADVGVQATAPAAAPRRGPGKRKPVKEEKQPRRLSLARA